MFDIGWGELLVIAVVALVVIGPKELPTVLRTVGQWVGKIRRMAAEFQGQFQEAMREAELHDLKKTFDDATATANEYGLNKFDPIGTVRREIEKAVGDLPSSPTATATTASAMPPIDPAAAGTGPAVPSAPAPAVEAAPVSVPVEPLVTPAEPVSAMLPTPAPVPAVDKQPS